MLACSLGVFLSLKHTFVVFYRFKCRTWWFINYRQIFFARCENTCTIIQHLILKMVLRFTQASFLYRFINLVHLCRLSCVCLMWGQCYHWKTLFVLSRRYNPVRLDNGWGLIYCRHCMLTSGSTSMNYWQGKSTCLVISLEQIFLDRKLLQHELYLSMPGHGAPIWLHLF
jgi:hypothetical protein